MTEEKKREQQIFIGKTIEDYIESRQTLAFLIHKMSDYRTAFLKIAANLAKNSVTEFAAARGDIQLPTQEQFDKLANDIKEEFEKKKRLVDTLRVLGVELVDSPIGLLGLWQ